MNVRFGLTCFSLLISCWCCTTPLASAASNGVRPRRQSRIATLNEYLTPPAPPNSRAPRGPEFSRYLHSHHGGPQPPRAPQGFGPPASPSFRHGKILTPSPTESPGYFARLMGWLNPFGSWQGSSSSQHQRPDDSPQRNFHSGYQQFPPVPNGYGAPAPSYGSPIISQEDYSAGKKLPYPPLPQGGQAYLPPQKTRNCNPCNQVPWVPLYNGINTDDARYAAGSTNLGPPDSSVPTPNHQDNRETTVYHLPSVSHEVRIPDFGYGPPASSSASDANHQASSSSVQLNVNNGYSDSSKNFNYADAKSQSFFTGPIPNPHLYPGAMPPLFKAAPFGPKLRDIDTTLNPPKVSDDYSERDPSFPGGATEGVDGGINSGVSPFAPSLDLRAPYPGPQDHRHKESSQGDGFRSPFDQQYEQPGQNVGSSSLLHSPVDHQQSSSNEFVTSVDQAGYVDELPAGAETVSPNPDGLFPPPSFSENRDHGAVNLDYPHTVLPAMDYRTQTSLPFRNEHSGLSVQEPQEFAQNLGNGGQSTSYGSSQAPSEGHQVIHFEQSPIIDLSSGGSDDRRKSSNDSSASSSTSTGTVEDPPVILQNQDGTYGINATWPIQDSEKIAWPKDDGFKIDVSTVAASTSPGEASGESSQSTNFQSSKASDIDDSATLTNFQQSHSIRNDSGFQGQSSEDSAIKNRTDEQTDHSGHNGNSGDSRDDGASNVSESARKQRPDLLDLYPGLIRFEDSGSYGFKLPDPPAGSISEEPFLKALMKSYANFKKDSGRNSDQPLILPDNRESWFDPRHMNLSGGFKPSGDHLQRLQTLVDAQLKSANRQEGAKRNKQVQIIIPYTSQYTPKPFHPLSEDWSAKTSPGQTQARKVPIFADANRDYLAQESRRVEDKKSQGLPPLKNPSRPKEITESSSPQKTNTSIDVLRLQKNIDNWTIQEYSRGTTASTEVPTFSRPYLSPSKKIPNEYLTTTEPGVSPKNTADEIGDVLAGFSFNDLDHEGSASDHIDVSHVQVSPHLNEVSSVFPKIVETTTLASPTTSTIGKDSWKELPVSISPLNKERVYVVTPQSVSTLPTTRIHKSYDRKVEINEARKISVKKQDLDRFESIERAYQVLPQAVNNLVVASTGPATVPLWGIMEHEKYVSKVNNSTPEVPVLYAGHSKVSHARQ